MKFSIEIGLDTIKTPKGAPEEGIDNKGEDALLPSYTYILGGNIQTSTSTKVSFTLEAEDKGGC